MIIAIDGPAGAGKSTVTRLLADRLGFLFLDTGAMYRAVTWAAVSRRIELTDNQALLELANVIQIEFHGEDVWVDGIDVTETIRTQEVTRNVVHIADHQGIRERMVELQREIASGGDFVCEGRDQGSVAFPNAMCKIYLNASPDFRAMRRVEQLKAAGKNVDFDQVFADQKLRDDQDSNREFGRLLRADDAIEVNTDEKSIVEVVDELEEIARRKMAEHRESSSSYVD